MLIKYHSLEHEPSESFLASGKQVDEARKQGLKIVNGGNGTYIVCSKSKYILTYSVKGKVMKQDIRPLISSYYNVQKVRTERAENFFDDLKSGKVTLKFNGCSLYF